MAKRIVLKSVAFNVLDPDQSQLLEHAMRRSNFSAYIKRLIQRDMEGGTVQQTLYREENFEFDRSIAEGLI